MKPEVLSKGRVEDFKNYCRKHKLEVDQTYLHEDEDLIDFEPNENNPTYIICNDKNEITAAASVVLNEYYRRGRTGRFRIFHSAVEDADCYNMLFKAITKHIEGLDSVFLHIPSVNEKLMRFVEGLGFRVERYSYDLLRELMDVPEPGLTEGYEIKPFKLGRDEKAWCDIRNISFAHHMGSNIPITPEMVAEQMTAVDHIEGGAMLLYHKERPVGIVRGVKDEDMGPEVMVILALAIMPGYQGKGLGRSMLRASLGFAKEKGYKRAVLNVNGENERAKTLYLDEGFKQIYASVCYKYYLKDF